MQITAGQIIDQRYKVLEPLGGGGFGAVYKAEQLNLERQIAIKIIEIDVTADDEAWQRMQREAIVLSNLHHRNIVSFYGCGLFRNTPYLVMEYVTGKTLYSVFLEVRPLSIGTIINYGMQICEGLSHAHHNGIIHRDLKPGNIMISPTESAPSGELVRIIDFGLAKLLPDFGKSVQKLTQTGATVGSVLYMSPEQCMASADARSDLYSLGAILYHCVSGQPPFLAPDDLSVMRSHLIDQFEPLKIRPHDDPKKFAELQKVISKAMTKDAGARYQSADDMFSDLQSIRDGAGIAIKSDYHQPNPLQAKGTDAKTAILAISAASMMFLLVATFALWQTTKEKNLAESTQTDAARGASYLYRQWRQQLSDLGEEEEAKKYPPAKKMEMFKEIIDLDARDHSLDADPIALKDIFRWFTISSFTQDSLDQGWQAFNSPHSRKYALTVPSVHDDLLAAAAWCAARTLAKKHVNAEEMADAFVIRTSCFKRIGQILDTPKPAYSSEPYELSSIIMAVARLDSHLPGDAKSRLHRDQVLLEKFPGNRLLNPANPWLNLASDYVSLPIPDNADAAKCWEHAGAYIDYVPNADREKIIDIIGTGLSSNSCWQQTVNFLVRTGCHDSMQYLALADAYEHLGKDDESLATLDGLWRITPTELSQTKAYLLRYRRLLLHEGKMARAAEFAERARRYMHDENLFAAPMNKN